MCFEARQYLRRNPHVSELSLAVDKQGLLLIRVENAAHCLGPEKIDTN